MNNVVLIGRLTKDPEIRSTTGGTAIARYTLAVDRRFKRDGEPSADFITCKAWSHNAEFAEKWLKKGVKIAVTGRIETGSYEGKNGKVYTTEVVVESQEFVERKADRPAPDDFAPVPDDESLPFAR